MRKRYRRIILLGFSLAGVLAGVPAALWLSLTHQPKFYRAMVAVPHAQSQERAKRFVAHSLQLRNDIVNEPRWEAIFTDREVNAWLAEDLVTHFADQLPPEVHEPRIVFEADRVTLAFQLDQGPVRSVISLVARIGVPEQNVLELTLEKIRAGAVPFPADPIIERITQRAQRHGLDIRWRHDGHTPVALIQYSPDKTRTDVVLEQIHIRNGQIRLAGRSNRVKGAVASPVLPRRQVLQSTFPRRNTQPAEAPGPPTSSVQSPTAPTS
jgi:hypothetical protein